MAKKKNEKNENKAGSVPSDFGHEIWGLIFLALSVLVLISLISHFVNGDANILGPVFGKRASSGLIFLFGPVPAFFFPLSVGYIGWLRLRGDILHFRTFFYWLMLGLQICLLLAIQYLPELTRNPDFNSGNDFIGLFLVKYIFKPVFGEYSFGPYFLSILALLITVLSCLRIPPQRLFGWLRILYSYFERKFAAWWEQYQKAKEESLKRRELLAQEAARKKAEKQAQKEAAKKELEAAKKEAARKEKDESNVEKTDTRKSEKKPPENTEKEKKSEPVAPPVEQIVPEQEPQRDISDVEEQARQQLERELAAFRAKKNEPIKIMSVETEEIDPEDSDAVDSGVVGSSPIEIGQLGSLVSADIPDIDEGDDEEVVEVGDDFSPRPEKKLPAKPYVVPDHSILPDPPPLSGMIDKDGIERNSMILEKTLMNFGVEGKVVFVSPGPVVTRYEIELAPGIKVSRVVSLHDDISMAVGGQRIRIEAPIPVKSAVGIELPNAERQIVHFKHILMSESFRRGKAKLPIVIGTNISGAPYVSDITKMPHVLIAGQTGSGKSVCINSIICSLLMTKKPEELRLIMIDPKKVELAFYEGIPHLLSPVVTESKEAVKALQWGVKEMERRYRMLAKVGARNIDSFNTRVESGKISDILSEEDNKALPFIVIIVDELADLMMTASKDVEVLIQRIAQLARAVGIHLIVATQRPSVDIITGPIKANLTSRIAFRTIQSTDSRTILGHVGAEKLLGMGDMLFLRNGAPEIERFHGAFISEEDVEKIVSEIRKQQVDIEKIESFHDEIDDSGNDQGIFDDGDRDELFEEAARTIVSIGQGSTSLLQRR
ncbi:MAG: DNA translocase FtsK, partial [Fibrobacter sp.]|nr:DNA translocase FtsK [Fibrobacter sp.]